MLSGEECMMIQSAFLESCADIRTTTELLAGKWTSEKVSYSYASITYDD